MKRHARLALVVLALAAPVACRKPEAPAPPGPAAVPPAPALPSTPASAPPPTMPPTPVAPPVGDASRPRLLAHRSPAVPPRCLPLGLGSAGSSFVFEVSVDERGAVTGVRTLERPTFTPPCPEFEPAWHAAIREWRYAPAMRRGHAVATTTTVSIDFKD